MVTIKIYIEGGGDGKDLDSRFREAWSKFFKAAGLEGKMPRPVRGKGRTNTFDLFCTAVENSTPNELPLLLLDSEDHVVTGHTVWQHLKARDGWNKPNNATLKHGYLMTQVMETWIIADQDSLEKFCGSKFKPHKIPAWRDLEAVPKLTILDVLDSATAECGERRYAKGKVSFEILGTVSPAVIAEKCPDCKRLLDFLADPR